MSKSLSSASLLVREYIWWPSVYIEKHQLALLVQPGSNQPPTRLEAGYQWHWPLLNVIRVINLQPILYHLQDQSAIKSWGDEPITVVTKDHHLIQLTGWLSLQVEPKAPLAILAELNKHTLPRLLKPLIRQQLRQVAASFSSREFEPSSKILSQTQHQLNQTLSQHGLSVQQLTLVHTPLTHLK